MQLKSWQFYLDWSIIFVKDRTTGESGSRFGDAVNGLLNAGTRHETTVPYNVRDASQILSDDESDFMHACRGESAISPTKHKKKNPNKHSSMELEVEGKIVDMMKIFIEKSDARWDKIIEKLGFDDGSTTRKKVFDAMEYVPDPSMGDNMKVTAAISNKKDFEIFFNTS